MSAGENSAGNAMLHLAGSHFFSIYIKQRKMPWMRKDEEEKCT